MTAYAGLDSAARRWDRHFRTYDEALSGFELKIFDVALIDLCMPGLLGDKVAERLRDALISVVANDWLKSGERRHPSGCLQGHVEKPFTEFDELLDVIGCAIAMHETRIDQTVTPG